MASVLLFPLFLTKIITSSMYSTHFSSYLIPHRTCVNNRVKLLSGQYYIRYVCDTINAVFHGFGYRFYSPEKGKP